MDDLFLICLTALLAVMLLLGLLAATIRLLTWLFPPPAESHAEAEAGAEASADAPLHAGLATAVATVFPGARVTRIRETTR